MKIESNTEHEITFQAESPGEYHIRKARVTGTLAATLPTVAITLTKADVQELAERMGLI